MFSTRVEYTTFDNGYSVSVVCGRGTYSDEGTYEVAVVTPEGNVLEPEGWVTPERLDGIKARVEKY